VWSLRLSLFAQKLDKRKMKASLIRLLMTGLFGLAGYTHGADDDGAALAWKYHCVTCHGQNGIANSDRYPNLAGQNVAYLVSRLRYFRDGTEPGNQMNAQAAPLSDEVIEKLSQYFKQQG